MIASPTITAAQHRHTAVYGQHPDSDRGRQLRRWRGLQPRSPFVGTLRSQAFDQAADPMVHQYNFNIQYQVTDTLVLETSYSGLLGRDLSSMFINVNQLPFSAALAGEKQTGRPAISEHQRDGDPGVLEREQQLQLIQFPRRQALLQADLPCW